MKKWMFIVLVLTVNLSWGQSENGSLSVGSQFYQNLLSPNSYQGFGVGLNGELKIAKGLGVAVNYFYESLDLSNTGNIKRFQRGIAMTYQPLYKKPLSPWLQLGIAYNSIVVSPVSYLFNDNSEMVIEQNYFGLNLGLGLRYAINRNLTVNTGFYFQPQDYIPNYELELSESTSVLKTNVSPENPKVNPLLYFNVGLTYKIARLW